MIRRRTVLQSPQEGLSPPVPDDREARTTTETPMTTSPSDPTQAAAPSMPPLRNVATSIALERVGVAAEIVKAIGGLPAAILAVMLLFPFATSAYLLIRVDRTLERIADTTEKRNALLDERARDERRKMDVIEALVRERVTTRAEPR